MTRSRARGFTLLELVVATALMSISVVGLLSLISSTLSNAARIKQYDRAAMLARTKMNELLVLEPLPLGANLAGQWDDDAGWKARFEPFERFPGAGRGGLQLVRVALEVWWTEASERKTVTLEGFRRYTPPPEPRP